MNQVFLVCLVVTSLFCSVLAFLEMGRRIGVWRRREDTEGAVAGLGVVDGAIFGLMGLMIAFTFSGAGGRFDTRRQLIGQEANAISTAYLRLDLLSAEAQPELKEDFRDYVDARLRFYKNLGWNWSLAWAEQAHSEALQKKIWGEAIAACKHEGPATTSLVLSSVNGMIDITTAQIVALQTHPPQAIYWGLLLLVLSSALLAGYGMAQAKTPSWVHMVIYAAAMAAAIYITLDFEYPRFGLIRIDPADQILIDVRKNLN